jgi:hypothetical protein
MGRKQESQGDRSRKRPKVKKKTPPETRTGEVRPNTRPIENGIRDRRKECTHRNREKKIKIKILSSKLTENRH